MTQSPKANRKEKGTCDDGNLSRSPTFTSEYISLRSFLEL